ncbi:hypothetical protein K2X30_03975, partial [bacterium]|nr:hypothetical protein [bacterium]
MAEHSYGKPWACAVASLKDIAKISVKLNFQACPVKNQIKKRCCTYLLASDSMILHKNQIRHQGQVQLWN